MHSQVVAVEEIADVEKLGSSARKLVGNAMVILGLIVHQ
jgi:hypothetical protein